MVVRRLLHTPARDVVFFKGVIEASEGLTPAVFAEARGRSLGGGPGPSDRPKLDALLDALCVELGGVRVGAGAGISTSPWWEAARRGRAPRFTLHAARGISASRILHCLEKALHPREKPCAGAVSAWGLEALKAIGVALEVPHVPMRGLRVLTAHHVGEQEAPLGVVVRRCELDASLWRAARADGVAASDGEPLVGLERAVCGWRLATSHRSVTARFVAACDGAGSTVRKLAGLRESGRKGHLYVAETPFVSADDGPRAGLCDFDLRVADAGIEGYYWDFLDDRGWAWPAVSRGIYHANFTAAPRSEEPPFAARSPHEASTPRG